MKELVWFKSTYWGEFKENRLENVSINALSETILIQIKNNF